MCVVLINNTYLTYFESIKKTIINNNLKNKTNEKIIYM